MAVWLCWSLKMAAGLCWFPLFLVLTQASASFLDTKQPIIFRDSDRSFGHQVAQLGQRLIVSAPRYQVAANKTGRIYGCDPRTTNCSPIPITGYEDEIDISLGLSLAARENPGQILVCGPTLQKPCGQNVYVNGRCYQLDQSLNVQKSLSAPPPECGLDVVFVIDGSASVGSYNFELMLNFVKQMISSLSNTDTQFAVLQYSHYITAEFKFRRFPSSSDLNTVRNIKFQDGYATKTPTAILSAVEKLFIPLSRKDSRKLLIVITDGLSNDRDVRFSDATLLAKSFGIQRISIGVGSAFSSGVAKRELDIIASSPDNVFQVNDFSALDKILKSLQEKIFAIEGTQSLSGQSFELEFSQEGFSAVLTSDGALLGAVGAYGWTGGAYSYRSGQEKATWINITQHAPDMKDSYMGYSLLQIQSDIIAMGAPRYQHTGRVFIFQRDPRSSQWSPVGQATSEQIGSYFGSALSVLRTSPSAFVLVVGAPTYYSPVAPGGRVYLCPISIREMTPQRTSKTFPCPETLQGESSQPMGHFGSAITVLPDLTADQYPELAIGAPLEDNGRGALYIFPGKPGGFRTSYIQRISGSLLGGGAQFFGRSVAGDKDMTGDGLPDVTVGGEGIAVILRSRPVLQASVSMTFSPRKFPLSSFECGEKIQRHTTEINVCFNNELKSRGGEARSSRKFPLSSFECGEKIQRHTTEINVCFNNELKSRGGETSASVQYTLLLDAGRTQTRAVFSDTPQPNTRMINSSQELQRRQQCIEYKIVLPDCVEDSLSPLRVSLSFSLIGNPVLSEDSRNNHLGEIPFEKNCGVDGVCEDDLRMSLTFSSLYLVVGLSLDVNLTVSVTNAGEESYNTRVLIPFPPDLSYRRVSLIQSNKRVTITCSSEETQRVLTCGVNRPLLRPNTTAIFLVSFHVAPTASLGDSLAMVANVTSDNGGFPNDLMKSSTTIKVQYSVYLTITSLEESSKYENFTSLEPSIKHVYTVKNLGVHPLPLSVTFLIPVRLGESTVWDKPNITSSEPQVTRCRTINEPEGPQNPRELLRTSPVLNCSVGTCLRSVCNISNMALGEVVTFTISGPVTKDWETQTDQQKVTLQSAAEIHYDRQMYFMEQNFTRAQAQTVLEVIVQYNYLPIIVGSSIGGLVLLALITAGLYKLGFFKRQYKQMLEDTEGENAANNGPVDAPTSGGPE
ncbi:integrin alpha-M-like [Hyla sarda]|uniref:integrin alpha-M-like n=1 Tax=Hyla sarda TaxID=327740 RepID=UPI0024C41FB3|nr:integrin alpha-M-like [Hyla sarda]